MPRQMKIENRRKKAIRSRIIVCLLFSAIIAALLPATASGATPKSKKVILVVMNAIQLEDLLATSAPNIKKLIESGGVGLMNARARGMSSSPGNYYLSLGAGARAEAGLFGNLGFNALERLPDDMYDGLLTAKDLNIQNNRRTVSHESIINLGINDAVARSFKFHQNVIPGLLGEALKQNDKKTAAIGNADTLDVEHREISLVTMDKHGVTDFGDVSGNVSELNRRFPGGLRTNYKILADKVVESAQTADFIAVELGDSARVDAERSLMKQSVNIATRSEALADADELIGFLLKKFPADKTMLILAVPQPQKDALVDRDYLTPIVITGIGRGAVISDTTKRPGIVGNVDVAPTILDYLGVPIPLEMAGNPIKLAPLSDANTFLQERHSQIVAMRSLRTPFLIVYSMLIIAFLAAALAFVRLRTLGRLPGTKYVTALKICLLFLLSVPVASLMQIPLDVGKTAVSIGSLMAISLVLALAAISLNRKNPVLPFLLIGATTTIIVAFDAMTGTILSERSFFGSDLISGGRYYGLGNTYMGIIIGAAILALTAGFSIRPAKNQRVAAVISGLSMLFISAIIGSPFIGANVGGLITGVAAALFLAGILWGEKVTWKTVAVNLMVFAVLAAGILSLGFPGRDSTSHAGKAAGVIQAKGSPAVLDIVIRKLTQNTRAIFSFYGFEVLFLILLLLALRWALAGDSFFGLLNPGFSVIVKGFKTMMFAAIIAEAFNDTGAVTVVCILIFMLVPFYVLALDPPNLKQRGASKP